MVELSRVRVLWWPHFCTSTPNRSCVHNPGDWDSINSLLIRLTAGDQQNAGVVGPIRSLLIRLTIHETPVSSRQVPAAISHVHAHNLKKSPSCSAYTGHVLRIQRYRVLRIRRNYLQYKVGRGGAKFSPPRLQSSALVK